MVAVPLSRGGTDMLLPCRGLRLSLCISFREFKVSGIAPCQIFHRTRTQDSPLSITFECGSCALGGQYIRMMARWSPKDGSCVQDLEFPDSSRAEGSCCGGALTLLFGLRVLVVRCTQAWQTCCLILDKSASCACTYGRKCCNMSKSQIL